MGSSHKSSIFSLFGLTQNGCTGRFYLEAMIAHEMVPLEDFKYRGNDCPRNGSMDGALYRDIIVPHKDVG